MNTRDRVVETLAAQSGLDQAVVEGLADELVCAELFPAAS